MTEAVLKPRTDRWFVAATLPSREEIAERNLRNQGFRPFLPRIVRTVRHARKLTSRRTAFFPGYIFVRLDVRKDRWRSVNGTVGVRSLVMDAEAPIPVPRGLVEEFQTLTDPNGVLHLASELKKGDVVRLAAGPLAGLLAHLDRLDGSGRARVLVQIMNGEISVSVDTRCLVPVRPGISGGH